MTDEYSFQEIEEILEGILNNRKLIEIKLSNSSKFIIFSYPNAGDILYSRYIRKKTLIEAKDAGLPSIEDITKMLSERDVITSEDKQQIKELEDKIVGQRRLLQVTKIPARKKTIEEAIEKYTQEINTLKNKGEEYYYLSQERKADEEAILYLAWASSFCIDGGKYWQTFQDFEKDTDLFFRSQVILEFAIFNRGLSTKTIRYVARHNLWRIRYVAALKTSNSLFDNGLSDLTPDQLSLLYWSNYYQSIYEMMPDDQPSDDVISDDEILDKFMKVYFEKREQEKNGGRIKRGVEKNKLSAWNNSDELIITPAHPEYMSLAYSKEKVRDSDGVSAVEVVSPNSRRARNSRARNRERIRGGAKGTRQA